MALTDEESKSKKFGRWLVTVAIVAILAATFSRIAYVVFQSFREPYFFKTTTVLTPSLRANEPLVVVYTGERRRLCPTTIAEFWISADDDDVEYRDRTPGGYAELGPFTTKVILRLPFIPAPGRYIYRSLIESDCGFINFTHRVPDAPFEIVQ